MKLAIMQPYFFPYLGYWQLLQSVDRFIIYDDVTYIKGGWINRNRIVINGQAKFITIPLMNASSYRAICGISISRSPVWKKKMVKSIEFAYRKAPFFSEVFPQIRQIILYPETSLSKFVANSIVSLAHFMEIETVLVETSRYYKNKSMSGQDRVIDICKQEMADIYINLLGGKTLYNVDDFSLSFIELQFIEMHAVTYKQRCPEFIPNLSIVDALMELGPQSIKQHLNDYSLI